MTASIATVAGVVPVLQIGISDSRVAAPIGQWDVTEWDDPAVSYWAGTEPLWRDVTCDAMRVESWQGRDRAMTRWDVSTATLEVVNWDGWADVLADPLSPSALMLRPGRAIRWGVAIDGGDPVWLWRGFIDSHMADYEGQSIIADVARFEAVDALGEAGRSFISELGAPRETASQRLTRLLDLVGWRAEHRTIADSNVPIIAADLDGRALDLLTVTADSAAGAIFGDRDGAVVFRHRDWQTWIPGSWPDAYVGNVDGPDYFEVVDVVEGVDDVVFGGDDVVFGRTVHQAAVCPVRFEVEFARGGATTLGMANFDGADTPPRVYNDLDGQRLYGLETAPERTDLVTDEAGTLDLIAKRLVTTGGVDTMPRIAAVHLDASTATSARDLIASADPTKPSRWRCVLARAGRTVFDRDMFVTGVQHSLDPDGWSCRVALDDAEPWQAPNIRWDQAHWDTPGDEWVDLGAAFDALGAALRELEGVT